MRPRRPARRGPSGGRGAIEADAGPFGDAGDADDGGPADDDSETDEEPPEDDLMDAGEPNTADPDRDGDPNWPPPPESEALQDLPEELASGICAALDGCLCDTLLEVALDGSDCEERTATELLDGDYVFLQASIDACRLRFDPDGVAAFVSAYAALGCEVVTSRAPRAVLRRVRRGRRLRARQDLRRAHRTRPVRTDPRRALRLLRRELRDGG